MNHSKKLGLAGLVLAGLVAVSSPGCSAPVSEVAITLPNGYQTSGSIKQSQVHKGSSNVFSKEENLEFKSRTNGQIISLTSYGENTVVMQLKAENKNYIFELKRMGIDFSPSAAFSIFKNGDLVSFPTIRKYESIDGILPGYRILKEFDYIYLEELEKVLSPKKNSK
jgi:hypothetical protein